MFPSLSSEYATVLALFQSRAAAIAQYQDEASGLWHQLVNDSTTFLETSSSAMYLTSIIRGVRNNWLSADDFAETINLV